MTARTALVTGASTGIGRAIALHLDARGWRVRAGVRREADGEALREAASERLSPSILDVTDPGDVAAARSAVEAEGGRLDALVNNAGYATAGPIEFLDLDQLRRQYEVNLFGQVAVTQALIPALRAARGRVVFIGSVGGRVSLPYMSPYQSSKAALASLAGALGHELRPWGIRVVTVEPGAVTTPIWDKAKSTATDLRERLPPQVGELYGDFLTASRTLPDRQAAAGMPPEDVAELVERVLEARSPRARYLIGREAKIMFVLSRLLPKRVFGGLVRRQMGASG